MSPVVLIATHQRVEMTIRNVKSILDQGAIVILIVSNLNEYQRFREAFVTGVSIFICDNNPLGRKWQFGINTTSLPMNPLIITGSDDVLGDGYIENACRLIKEGNHFIGLRRWWQHKDGRAFYCQYQAKDNLPLGGGRCYSAEMLKAINYRVFDPTKDKHLDELGWDNARKSGLKCLLLDNPEKEGLSIHAIKGDWPVMNQFTLSHKNIRLIRSKKAEKVLPSFYAP